MGTFVEEYIGKIPEFIAVEKEFDALLAAYKTNRTLNPNTRNETRNIEKLIKKFFGLKECKIWWRPIFYENAMTYTESVLLHDEIASGILKKQKGKGFYDINHEMTFVIVIYNGILSPNHNLTGKELTAIVVHELGHNCDDSPYLKMDKWTSTFIKLIGESPHAHNENIKALVYDVLKWEDEPEYKAEWWYLYSQMVENEQKTMVEMNRSDEFLKKRVKKLLKEWLDIRKDREETQLRQASDRLAEQYADSFAAAYGYGPELISAFNKMSDYSMYKVGKKSKLNDFLYELAEIQIEMIGLIDDPHSTSQVRCKDLIIKLRKDLKNNEYGPDVKSSLESELAKIEKQYAMMLENGSWISKMWHKFVDRNYNGGKRDLVTDYIGRHQM